MGHTKSPEPQPPRPVGIPRWLAIALAPIVGLVVIPAVHAGIPWAREVNPGVVEGNGLILQVSHGIMFGDLFQTLYGQMQITFQVLPRVEGSERMGPASREMFVHAL
jgi:hypothetical protein